MQNKISRKVNRESGAATIEAIISFTGFLFVIFTFLGVINICRTQMLVSNAVDTATKELTQYAYFYKMSGLQKFSSELSATAETGKTSLNEVIGTVDQLYSSIGTAIDEGVEHGTNVKNAVQSGNVNVADVQNALFSVGNDITNVETAINSVTSAFGAVQDNPLLYMKSLVAVAGSEGLDLLKSHIIAAPLAKMFVSKHFGATKEEADRYLENLGVVDGLDGMNFSMSTIFTSDSPEDVHIVVYYKIKFVQLFNWGLIEVPLCKESVARAWLAGDDVQAKVKPAPTPTPTPTPLPGQMPSITPGVSPELTPSVTPDAGGNKSTGLWALIDNEYDNRERQSAFGDYLDQEMMTQHLFGSLHYHPYDDEVITYACYAQKDWKYKPYETIGGNINNPGASILTTWLRGALEQSGMLHTSEKESDPRVIGCVYVVYVPENIPEEQYNNLLSDIEAAKKEIAEYISNNTDGVPKDIYYNFEVKKSQGTFDYDYDAENPETD